MKISKLAITASVLLTMLSACDVDNALRDLGKNSNKPNAETEESISKLAEENTRGLEDFVVSTLATIPKQKISSTQGYYCRMFAFEGYNYSTQFNRVIAEIIQEGKKNGAHALVNMTTTAIPFNQSIKNNKNLEEKSSNLDNNLNNANNSGNKNTNINFTNNQSIVQVCGDMVTVEAEK